MKTEDIDSKINMPDIDTEWAKFESVQIDSYSAKNEADLKKCSPKKGFHISYKMAAAIIIFMISAVGFGVSVGVISYINNSIPHYKPKTVYKIIDIPKSIKNDNKSDARNIWIKANNLKVYDIMYGSSCSWYCNNWPENVTASSELPAKGKYTYSASNAHDLNHETAWAEGAEGDGIGEYLLYNFKGSTNKITKIMIMNGYVKSKKAWEENGRVKALKVYYSNKPCAILELEDSRTQQEFEIGALGYADSKKPGWSLKFEIIDVYPGTKYKDTVISELYFDGPSH